MAVASIALLLCPSCKQDGSAAEPPAPPRILDVTLDYEDSLGRVAKTVPAESVGATLNGIITALRLAKPGKRLPRQPSDTADTAAVLGPLERECMCDAPTDSLRIRLSDGSEERYSAYCSGFMAYRGPDGIDLIIPDITKGILNSRWDGLRARYCRRGFGCSDGAPRWHSRVERLEGSGWLACDGPECRVEEYLWSRIMDSTGADEPEIAIRIQVSRDGRSLPAVTVDSVAEKYRAPAESYARRCAGSPRLDAPAGRYRVTAYNYYYEK